MCIRDRKPTGHETDFEKNVIDIVKANGFENDCMLASLDIEALKTVKEIDPNIKTLYDMTVAAGNISEMTFIDGFSIEETFIAVSYTHLDVYRRQMSGC